MRKCHLNLYLRRLLPYLWEGIWRHTSRLSQHELPRSVWTVIRANSVQRKATKSVRKMACFEIWSGIVEPGGTPGLQSFIIFWSPMFISTEAIGYKIDGKSRPWKAFDTVEWAFIHKTLQHFNFGPSLVNCINTFYNNSESCVLNNGLNNGFFKLERGVRQGCPLSPYLFILCVEILAEKVRTCQNIKGIKVFGQEIKISQYAGDTTLILDGSNEASRPLCRFCGMISGKFQV